MPAPPTSLRLAADPAIADLIDHAKLRPSIPLKAAAAAISVDRSWIRKLLEANELEGHRAGKRAIRVYVDSLEAYQRRQPIGGNGGKPSLPRRRPKPRPVETAAHREAMACLLQADLLPQDAKGAQRRVRR